MRPRHEVEGEGKVRCCCRLKGKWIHGPRVKKGMEFSLNSFSCFDNLVLVNFFVCSVYGLHLSHISFMGILRYCPEALLSSLTLIQQWYSC